jgi:DNA-binding LacI/PurR family transcriptional regulator
MPAYGEANGRRPTIRDVAERAGVSKSLVSLVMRGEPMVREDKRRRVHQAAEELGYRMNLAARSLSNTRSKTIGVLVADLRNPLLVDVVEQAREVLEDEGLSTLLISAVKPARPASGSRIDGRAIGALKDLRVEAMLVVGSVPDRRGLAEVLGDMPVVVAAAGAEGLRADVVRNDDHLGMRLVVDYLAAVGHSAIAHLGGMGGAVAEERVAGYCAAMAHHGFESQIVVAGSDFTEDAGYRGAARLLRDGRPVTAIAAINDLAAVGAMSAVADAGLRVPGDVAITGYDDTFVSAIRQVSLTSVNPDSFGIGTQAAHCVLRPEGRPTATRTRDCVGPVMRSSRLRRPGLLSLIDWCGGSEVRTWVSRLVTDELADAESFTPATRVPWSAPAKATKGQSCPNNQPTALLGQKKRSSREAATRGMAT